MTRRKKVRSLVTAVSIPAAVALFGAPAIAAPGVPSAPSDVGVTATGPNEVRVGWSDTSTDESGFEIRRGSQVRGAGANATSFTWGGGSGPWCFQVRAVNPDGPSAWAPASPVCVTGAGAGGAAGFGVGGTQQAAPVIQTGGGGGGGTTVNIQQIQQIQNNIQQTSDPAELRKLQADLDALKAQVAAAPKTAETENLLNQLDESQGQAKEKIEKADPGTATLPDQTGTEPGTNRPTDTEPAGTTPTGTTPAGTTPTGTTSTGSGTSPDGTGGAGTSTSGQPTGTTNPPADSTNQPAGEASSTATGASGDTPPVTAPDMAGAPST